MGSKRILAIACMPFYLEKGSSLRTYSIMRILSKKYQIDLVTYPHGEEKNFDHINNIKTTKLFKPKISTNKPTFSKIILDMFVFFKVLKLLTLKKYEVIHSEDFEAAFIGAISSKIFRKKLVYSLHNRVNDNLKISRTKVPFWIKKAEKFVVKSSSMIISNWGLYLSDKIFSDKRIFLQYDSMNLKTKKTKLIKTKYLFYAGNFEKYQGILDFLQAFKISSDTYPLLIAGEPTEEIIRFIEYNQLTERVFLLGRKSIEETNYLIKNSYACILPRNYGRQPSMKLIHYLLWEKPIIATHNLCNKELIKDKYNGFLYKNHGELIELLKKIKEKDYIERIKPGIKETHKEIKKFTNSERFLREYSP